MRKYIKQNLEMAGKTLEAILASTQTQARLEEAAQICITALQRKNKILLAGNGGSAADCQHIAGELVGRFAFNRPALPAVALSTDSSVLTAIGNDYGYTSLFSRQVEALGQAGDVLIAYSTSGTSPNILAALEQAERMGIARIGLTGGKESPMGKHCDILLETPSASTPRIQEGHLILGHILCGLVENALFGEAAS